MLYLREQTQETKRLKDAQYAADIWCSDIQYQKDVLGGRTGKRMQEFVRRWFQEADDPRRMRLMNWPPGGAGLAIHRVAQVVNLAFKKLPSFTGDVPEWLSQTAEDVFWQSMKVAGRIMPTVGSVAIRPQATRRNGRPPTIKRLLPNQVVLNFEEDGDCTLAAEPLAMYGGQRQREAFLTWDVRDEANPRYGVVIGWEALKRGEFKEVIREGAAYGYQDELGVPTVPHVFVTDPRVDQVMGVTVLAQII